MRLEDVRVGMKVEVIKEDCENNAYYSTGAKGTVTKVRDIDCEVRFYEGDYSEDCNSEWYVKAEFIEPYVDPSDNPQPVDLSTVKVGEKYVIGEIDNGWDEMYTIDGDFLKDNEGDLLKYKSGDVVEIVKDYGEYLCFSIDKSKDCSHTIDSILNSPEGLTLYPYTEPSEPEFEESILVYESTEPELDFTDEDLDEMEKQCEPSKPPQDDSQLILGVTPENENISTESEYTVPTPTDDNIKYARSYYSGYIRLARTYVNQFNEYSALICDTEDEKRFVLEDSLKWTIDATMCRIQDIFQIGDDSIEILHESMMDLESFDTMIGRLKVNGIIK